MAKRTRVTRAWGQLDIEDTTPEAKRNIDRNLVAALTESAAPLKATAIREVPVDEGDLQRSIDTAVDADKLSLALTAGGPGAKHAFLVEFGPAHAKPNPFMRRAIKKNRPPVLAKIKTALGRKQT